MPAKITRLELVIIGAALAVLLLSNRPPQPGSADIRMDSGPTPADMPDSMPQTQSPDPLPPEGSQAGSIPADGTTSDNPTTEPLPRPQPKQKRFAMVDARKCDSLKYPHVMYGEVTVRWIWDGSRFVPRKVCEVKEANGTISIWSFDDRHEGVTISELPADQAPTY